MVYKQTFTYINSPLMNNLELIQEVLDKKLAKVSSIKMCF